jgi:hypothetical protein
MRFIVMIAFIFSLITLTAQDKVIVKYYDSLWVPCVKEKAIYISEFENRDSFFACSTFFYPSKKIHSHRITLDTNIHNSIGLKLEYFENGKLKGSSFTYPRGRLIYEYSYYESGDKFEINRFGKDGLTFDCWAYYKSGMLWAHTYKSSVDSKEQCDAFDENRNSIPNYIYKKPAYFPGGIRGWQFYLERNLNRDLAVRRGAPAGKYTVYVVFVIDKDGRVTDVKAENDPGYGTKEEAERVIAKGPKWEPAIQYNRPVMYRHKQGITFVVSQ